MAYSDNDPLEDDMGVRCEDMNPDQLVSYILSYQKAFGLNIVIEGNPERAVFRALQRSYGKRDAGRIVKWVFYKYRGTWRDESITPLSFSKGRKWWTDKMHLELQREVTKENPRSYTGQTLGITSLADL